MSEEAVNSKKTGGKGKIGIIIAIAVVVIGGIIAYFALGSAGSDKAKYFKAEADTYEFIVDEFKERYADELEFMEMTEENPSESTVNITANYNDPNAFGGPSEVEEIINNAKISLLAQADIQEELLFTDITAEVMGVTFDDFKFGLEGNKLLIDLPFLKDVLLIDGENIGELLYQVDPYSFDPDMDIDFASVFDQDNYPISEEDQEYLKETYGKFIYDQISDEAFESENEDITVEGEDLSTEKITLHLAEDDVKDIIVSLAEEAQEDDRLKEIMTDYFKASFLPEDEIEMAMSEFDEGLQEIQDTIDDLELPEGITSEIWIDDGLIVQRDFNFATVSAFDEEIEFSASGTQLLADDEQIFDYTLTFVDEFSEEDVSLVGNLSFDGETIDDEITLGIEMGDLTYTANETVNKGEKTFERSVSLASPFINGGLVWSGDSNIEKDQMSGNHEVNLDADGMDIITLNIDTTAQRISDVETISQDSVKDIGSMSEQEITEYINSEAADQFFEWYTEKFGGF